MDLKLIVYGPAGIVLHEQRFPLGPIDVVTGYEFRLSDCDDVIHDQPIVRQSFALHGERYHTICRRRPGSEDDPAADNITEVEW